MSYFLGEGLTREVVLIDMSHIDDGVTYISDLSHLPRLEYLAVGDIPITPEDVRQLCGIPGMRALMVDAVALQQTTMTALDAAPLLVWISQRSAIAAARAAGGSVYSVHVAPPEDLAAKFALEHFERAQDMLLRDTHVLRQAALVLGPSVTGLDLSASDVADNDLAVLAGFANLEFLSLDRTTLNGEGLKSLACLGRLTRLSLRQVPHLKVEHLGYLASLKSLEKLDMSRNRLAESAVPFLQQLTQVKSLDISGARIGPERLSDLRESLTGCDIRY
jgi:hypothetical protein